MTVGQASRVSFSALLCQAHCKSSTPGGGARTRDKVEKSSGVPKAQPVDVPSGNSQDFLWGFCYLVGFSLLLTKENL